MERLYLLDKWLIFAGEIYTLHNNYPIKLETFHYNPQFS